MVSRPYITVRGIIYRDGELFLQKLKSEGNILPFWCTPGGKLDAGEDVLSGLRREMIEETGIEPVIGKLLFIQQFIDDKSTEWMDFFFHIENAVDYKSIDLESTTHGVLEVSECGFVDPKKVTALPEALAEIDFAKHIKENRSAIMVNYL